MDFLKSISKRTLSLAFAVSFLSIPAQAGRIVVNHDEWTTSDVGYAHSGAANAHRFTLNLSNFLAGARGKILVYSDVFALNESSFKASLAAGGFDVTYGKASSDLSGYDAVFVSESLPGDAAALAAFVNGGGGVYIEGGTGYPGPEEEAARWNGFLNPFGLHMDSEYNLCCGNDAVDNNRHRLFNGVSQLYYDNGNTVMAMGRNPYASVVERDALGRGLIGVYDSAMPEPSTYALVGGGLLAAWLKRRSAMRASGR